MGRKRGKKFIDKKKDVLYTFKLVPRSQQDPLIADENAPQSVLVDVEERRKEEQRQYGVYFDDSYDYLQHLRDIRESVKYNNEELEVYTIRREDPRLEKAKRFGKTLLLPSSAFESYVEEPVGLLNKAAPLTGPRPELDPDVVAGLDDASSLFCGDICDPDDTDDEQFPDDFVKMLNADEPVAEVDNDDDEWEDVSEDGDVLPALEGSDNEMYNAAQLDRQRCLSKDEEHDFGSDFNDSDDEGRDQLGSLDGPSFTFRDEETKSHFTNYSLSSSVISRNEKLSLLDDQFEESFFKEYNDESVGALDGEDIEGFVTEKSELFQQMLEQTQRDLDKDKQLSEDDWVIRWIKNVGCKGNAADTEEVVIHEKPDPKEKWDCESILSTYSSLYNHPTMIAVPPKTRKIAVSSITGMPIGELDGSGRLTKKALARHNQDEDKEKDIETESLITSISAISIRPPGETPEERSARKKALKELRRERRIEKAANKELFKVEKLKQQKIMMNARVNKKVAVC